MRPRDQPATVAQAARLRTLRHARHLSQAAVAQILRAATGFRVSGVNVSQWETGADWLSEERCAQYCTILGALPLPPAGCSAKCPVHCRPEPTP